MVVFRSFVLGPRCLTRHSGSRHHASFASLYISVCSSSAEESTEEEAQAGDRSSLCDTWCRHSKGQGATGRWPEDRPTSPEGEDRKSLYSMMSGRL